MRFQNLAQFEQNVLSPVPLQAERDFLFTGGNAPIPKSGECPWIAFTSYNGAYNLMR
jgi:hypothetical protein